VKNSGYLDGWARGDHDCVVLDGAASADQVPCRFGPTLACGQARNDVPRVNAPDLVVATNLMGIRTGGVRIVAFAGDDLRRKTEALVFM
jgi:hypothetical protein